MPALANSVLPTSGPTPEQTKAALGVLLAVAETVRESKRCPSGVVYAALMGRITLSGYEKILGILKRSGLIEETKGHELVWIGGEVRS